MCIGWKQREGRVPGEWPGGAEVAFVEGCDAHRTQPGGQREKRRIREPDLLVFPGRGHGIRPPLDDVGTGGQIFVERQRGVRPAATGDAR